MLSKPFPRSLPRLRTGDRPQFGLHTPFSVTNCPKSACAVLVWKAIQVEHILFILFVQSFFHWSQFSLEKYILTSKTAGTGSCGIGRTSWHWHNFGKSSWRENYKGWVLQWHLSYNTWYNVEFDIKFRLSFQRQNFILFNLLSVVYICVNFDSSIMLAIKSSNN